MLNKPPGNKVHPITEFTSGMLGYAGDAMRHMEGWNGFL